MSLGSPVAADVPNLYDVIVAGHGYIFLRTIDTSLPFRTQRARYTRSQTFTERSNVSNAYGDNAQDFFLTIRQRNWSLGEQQKFFRAGQDGSYWQGENVDVSIPGQVSLALDKVEVTFPDVVAGAAKDRDSEDLVAASATNLYSVAGDGTVSDLGAHGLGVIPSWRAVVSDQTKVYLSDGGGVGVISWDGSLFATFSDVPVDSLAYLNNSLYGYAPDGAKLVVFASDGTTIELFSWKAADGSTSIINRCKLVPWGGKLLIGFQRARPNASDLWIYDGTGVSRLEVFPENFDLSDIFVLYGVVYIAGSFRRFQVPV